MCLWMYLPFVVGSGDASKSNQCHMWCRQLKSRCYVIQLHELSAQRYAGMYIVGDGCSTNSIVDI